ncbi:hypothetical protein [Luteimonas sp. 3794]|uniref:hypothetical protein n=1 Tax=Luteimonas sp. 3794 TaxID=2817730 RepID=UPI00286AD8A8|nr:hypothetical protein [Luteimonas sp. 3794]
MNAQEIAIYEAMGAGDQFEKRSADEIADCRTDGSSDFSTRGYWLDKAAAGGSLEAKLIYATDVDAFFPSAAEMIRDPQGLEEYKRKSVRYMSDLAANGNIESMIWIARAYESGWMMERSPVNSYAYYKAVDLSMPGVMPGDMLNHLRGLLPANEQLRADDLARSIHGRCCDGH